MAKSFASTGDLAEKKISFSEIGPGFYAFTAEGDPNTGVIIGDDGVMVVDAQATPQMADKVIARIRAVTDKPIRYVVLSHYHAVRVLGASAFHADEIIASETCRAMIHERGQEDWESEYRRFPRLFQSPESIPGLTWPSITFTDKMTVYLGQRRVDLIHLGRAHTAGDIVALGAGRAASCTRATSWNITRPVTAATAISAIGRRRSTPSQPIRPDAIAPGRGDALVGQAKVNEALALTRDFLDSTYRPVAQVAARGGSLKDAMAACRAVCDAKFSSYAIYEHCLPFNVARAYDEALGIDTPRIWTAERDQIMWAALQG